MKPTCFGNYDPMPRAVCCSCGYRAKCAFSTRIAGFRVLPLAVMPKKSNDLMEMPGVSASLEDLDLRMKALGYQRTGATYRHSSRRAVAKVSVVGPAFSIITKIPKNVVEGFPEASSCDVRHNILPRKSKDSFKTAALRRDGTRITCLSALCAFSILHRIVIYEGSSHEH